jgi:serine/threonine-protein kinase HipA
MRKATVLLHNAPVGTVWEDENGFFFQYFPDFVANKNASAVSLTLPVRLESYHSDTILPFFDGLIPEGWLLEIAENYWKIKHRDRVGLLFACCRDCIGAVSILHDETAQ